MPEDFYPFCLDFHRNPALLPQKFLPETASEGAQVQTDRGRGCGFGGTTCRAGQRPAAHASTSGQRGELLVPVAPAKVQNNDKQAARPTSGAKHPWNARSSAQASLSATSKRAFLRREQGPCISKALWARSVASQPGFPMCACDVCPGTGSGWVQGLRPRACLGLEFFNHAVSASSSGKWGSWEDLSLRVTHRVKYVNSLEQSLAHTKGPLRL